MEINLNAGMKTNKYSHTTGHSLKSLSNASSIVNHLLDICLMNLYSGNLKLAFLHSGPIETGI